MPPPVLFAGLDGRSLVLEAPILKREGHVLEEAGSAKALINGLAKSRARLVVLGPEHAHSARADGTQARQEAAALVECH